MSHIKTTIVSWFNTLANAKKNEEFRDSVFLLMEDIDSGIIPYENLFQVIRKWYRETYQ